MQNFCFAQSHSIPYKMKVNLDMFGSLKLDRMRGEVHGTHIITIHHGGVPRRTMKLAQKLSKPA
jgi:hypothetical protein